MDRFIMGGMPDADYVPFPFKPEVEYVVEDKRLAEAVADRTRFQRALEGRDPQSLEYAMIMADFRRADQRVLYWSSQRG